MKASTFLFAAIVAVLGAALVFSWPGKSFVARAPSSRPQTFPKLDPELQKTEASLKRLENIRLTGVSLPEALDRLLPLREAGNPPVGRLADAREENGGALFPVLAPGASGGAYANNSIEGGPLARSAQTNPARGAPAAGSATGGAYANNSIESGPSAQDAVAENVNVVSLTYVSPGFRRAVVDGQLVREGSRLRDGTHVSSIRKNSVVLTRDGKRVGVPVPRSFSAHPAPTPEAGGRP
ncbi:MAG: hypothetical protein LBE85_06850 [Candidatus Accumulibacter sp.]|jgi:hypothetical protein|nr:hypothetical protein [Accumulibacter sp.]